MSKGSRKKRATRPWQDATAFRDIGDLLVPSSEEDELRLEGYEVQQVAAGRTDKAYVCPECGNTIAAGESHVVVWPAGDPDLRRHWHRHCWRFEVNRSRSESEA